MEINKEFCGIENPESKFYRKPVLQNEIENLSTFLVYFPANKLFNFPTSNDRIHIFLFTIGKGKIIQKSQEFSTNEIAVFVPVQSKDFTIETKDENLVGLEIVLKLSDAELDEIRKRQTSYFKTYSDCKKYKEAIKSPKTINRMVIPEDIVPRFCMGSVETSGPDKVEAHSHSMLEQLFFGLEQNNCIVIADKNETVFKENVLLHIPLGSEHGVMVEEGKMLNYIWMDFFRSESDMDYITKTHIIQED